MNVNVNVKTTWQTLALDVWHFCARKLLVLPPVLPCQIPSFDRSNHTSVIYYYEDPVENLDRPIAPRLSRSLKVTKTDTDRSDLWLPVSDGPILFPRSQAINAKFSHLVYLTPPLRGSLEFCNGAGLKKQTRMIPVADCQKVWRYPFV